MVVRSRRLANIAIITAALSAIIALPTSLSVLFYIAISLSLLALIISIVSLKVGQRLPDELRSSKYRIYFGLGLSLFVLLAEIAWLIIVRNFS
ncbi:MAG: hypothetical protein CO091_09030 [Candidatus Aquicultor secundus]|nr:MAG: hypothetical protein CO091_09030 [Candidatus Aquicultor secundus]